MACETAELGACSRDLTSSWPATLQALRVLIQWGVSPKLRSNEQRPSSS